MEISTLSWDQEKVRNASVGKYTLNESNKRGDWLKSWLMLNEYSALNTMFRKTPQKQTSFVSPKGKEKQIDYILTKRRYLRNVKDADANDMIHMGSDHRCVMATFLINMPEKKINVRREYSKHETTMYVEHEEKDENNNMEMSELEKISGYYRHDKKSRRRKKKEKHVTQKTMKKYRSSSRSRKHSCCKCSTRD